MFLQFFKRFGNAYLVVLLPVWGCSSILSAQNSAPTAYAQDTVLSRASEAAKTGKTSITIPYGVYNYAEAGSLQDALKDTSSVVAEVVASETSHTEGEIITWRKYRVVEQLSSQPVQVKSALPSGIPASLLPIRPDEFLLPLVGGTLKLDGVEVTENNGELDISPNSKTHLLFLVFFSSPEGRIAALNYGPNSFYWIDKDEKIHPAGLNPNSSINDDLRLRAGANLNTLRAITPALVGLSVK